ncbi:hypothetical protein [Bradyrhizobium sp. AZCC 2289]|uniref:hypothetical protein n=1 Tax=Bradyrhizobium sp. AZCC 2289 TaxID=3117026 RepID=UPI002FF29BAC
MLMVAADPRDTARASRLLKAQLGAGAEVYIRRLVWPGPAEKIADARLQYRSDDQLWSYMWWSEEWKRWQFCYGIDVAPGPVQVPTIEINFAARQIDRYLTGRVLVDEAGNTYLAHKGELKGGRTGVVDARSFEQQVNGFSKQQALWPNGKVERLFVIGAIGQLGFTKRLGAFVSEAQRLRGLAREGRLADHVPQGPTYKQGYVGKTSGTRSAEYEIDRWHDLIVDELHRELKRRGLCTFTSEHKEMKPDLYSLTKDGKLRHLFEIKTNQDTSTLYTAIGQLVVYGAAQARPPRRFLVVENPVEDLNFQKALANHQIAVVNFRREGRKRISFPGLDQHSRTWSSS